MKSVMELNRLLLKFPNVMLCGYLGKFFKRLNAKFNFLGITLELIFWAFRECKIQNLPPVGTMVLPSRYFGFVANLSFWLLWGWNICCNSLLATCNLLYHSIALLYVAKFIKLLGSLHFIIHDTHLFFCFKR